MASTPPVERFHNQLRVFLSMLQSDTKAARASSAKEGGAQTSTRDFLVNQEPLIAEDSRHFNVDDVIEEVYYSLLHTVAKKEVQDTGDPAYSIESPECNTRPQKAIVFAIEDLHMIEEANQHPNARLGKGHYSPVAPGEILNVNIKPAVLKVEDNVTDGM
ncbi:MAG: hypothetical protein Q9166_006661 [cf. Caloplaca sp. 2 TL-2023]